MSCITYAAYPCDLHVYICTGGASGIGLGIVEFLIKRGAKVAILDKQAQQGVEVAGRLGDKAIFCQTVRLGSRPGLTDVIIYQLTRGPRMSRAGSHNIKHSKGLRKHSVVA